MPQDVRQAGRNHPKSLGNEDISDGSRLTGGRRVVDVEQRIAGGAQSRLAHAVEAKEFYRLVLQ